MNLKIRRAINWLSYTLDSLNVDFVISGGVAARMYGSRRKIFDIDIDIKNENFKKVYSNTKSYTVFGPAKFKDSCWDLTMFTLSYQGQLIDICAYDSAMIFDCTGKGWGKYPDAFYKPELVEIGVNTLKIISRDLLVEYKTRLGRDVDNEDIKQITR